AAEDLFAKASEYLESGCQEVWLVFPENKRVLIITENQTLAFKAGDIVNTQIILLGFSLEINQLFG
ncbi:MAG: Uma2 family endonuclease, partial [Planktothrix sp.]